MAKTKIGIEIKSCTECQKKSVGVMLCDLFEMGDSVNFNIMYDRATKTFLIDENAIKRAIMLCNSGQPERNVKLVTREELYEARHKS